MTPNPSQSFEGSRLVATVRIPVLASKLRAPPQSDANIRREEIERCIRNAPAAKLILVRGPAGFGKTTTMLLYYGQLLSDGVAAAWLKLDDDDNEFERFLVHVHLIFERIAGTTPADKQPTMHETATSLICRIADFDHPFVLLMDECENIKSPAVLDFLRRMIRHLPTAGRLVIGSRNVPDLGVGRLRVSHQLLDIGPGQLRFSLEETANLFRSRQQLSLSDEEIQLLHHQTEGWAAALHLASLSLSSGGDHKELIASFSGSHAGVADYLEEDVFSKLPDELQSFLLQTCVLSELCAPLCAAVTGNARSDELLVKLESAHLFLMPLDAERQWYRYHMLFADFLRTRLKRRHPELMANLHRAASRWYIAEDRPVHAIEHALAGEDPAEALVLIEEYGERLLKQYRAASLVRWYRSLPKSVFDSHPRSRILFAWALAFTHRPAEAISLIDDLSHSSNESLPGPNVYLSCMAIRAASLMMSDQLVACSEACEEASLALLGKPSFPGGTFALFRILCLIAADKFEEAKLMIAETQRHYASVVLTFPEFTRFSTHALTSLLDLIQGRLRDAQKGLRRIIADRVADPNHDLKPLTLLNVLLAELLYQGDELTEAERLLIEYLPLACERGLPDTVIVGHITLARIAYARGDRARTFGILSGLDHLGHQERLPRLVVNHWLERARIALLEGNTGEAKTFLSYASTREVWEPFRSMVPRANDVDTPAIGHLRLLIRSGRGEEALPDVKRQLREAHERTRHRRGLKLKILLAEALHGCGQTKPAMRVLHEAIQFAAREGFVRTFVEEGAAVARLLLTLRQTTLPEAEVTADGTVPTEFIDRVLRAGGHSMEGTPLPTEILSPQFAGELTPGELRVLELLAQGLSNASIAEKLFVAPTTVRSHLRNINAKLGAHNRTQAVAVAQRHGLIAIRV